MVLNTLRLGLKKNNPKFWEDRLEKGWYELQNSNIESARVLFSEIRSDYVRLKVDQGDPRLSGYLVEARTALWIMSYSDDLATAKDCRLIFESSQPTTLSIVRASQALGRKMDTSIDAISIYKRLLQAKPSDKVAKAIANILENAEYSSEALELLQAVCQSLPDDLSVTSLVFRWARNSGNHELASVFALRILTLQPDNQTAHRFLGSEAEKKQDWENAKLHYTACKENLRTAIALNHLGDYPLAWSYLARIPDEGKLTQTWLYHAGWTAYKSNRSDLAQKYWNLLAERFPEKHKHISNQIKAIQIAELMRFTDGLYRLTTKHIPDGPEPYFSELCLRKGLVELLINRDQKIAEKYFTISIARSPAKELPKVLLAVTQSITEGPDPGKIISPDGRKFNIPSPSLFFWFIGLWLAQVQPESAVDFLDIALKTRESDDRLSDSLILGTKWLNSKMVENRSCKGDKVYLDEFQATDLGFKSNALKMIELPYALGMVTSSNLKSSPWIENLNPVEASDADICTVIRLIYFVRQSQWDKALDVAIDSNRDDFIAPLISHLFQFIRNDGDSFEWVHYLSRLAEKFPSHPMLNQWAVYFDESRLEKYWSEQYLFDLVRILKVLLRVRSGDTALHHYLALVYTRLAIQQDQNGKAERTVDYWKSALGYWAVTLTSPKYWNKWLKKRVSVYGSDVEKALLDKVRREGIPAILQEHFNEIVEYMDKDSASGYKLYPELLKQEIDQTTIMRRFISEAQKNDVPLPYEVYQLVSPLLIREHGSAQTLADLSIAMDNMDISPANRSAIKIALSNLNEVKALTRGGFYEDAIQLLEEIEKNPGLKEEDQTLIRNELLDTHKNFARALIDGKDWVYAIEVSNKALSLFPDDISLRDFYIESIVGWGDKVLSENGFERVIDFLQRIESYPVKSNNSVKILQAEALAERGVHFQTLEDTKQAESNFRDALGIDSENMKAKNGLALILFQRVLDLEKSGYLRNMYDTAWDLYNLMKDGISATLCAQATIRYTAWIIDTHKNYREAINALEKVLPLPYDIGEVQVEKFFSAVLTDYGAMLFNGGSYAEGTKITKRALDLDPLNTTARSNIRIARGY